MTCRDACLYLSHALDHSLSLAQRVGLWLHLRLCRDCRTYRRQLTILDQCCRQSEPKSDATLTLIARQKMSQTLEKLV